MNNKELIDMIYRITKSVSCKEINQLRLEEEILIALAQNTRQGLNVRAEALRRVAKINELQLKLLGSNLNSSRIKR